MLATSSTIYEVKLFILALEFFSSGNQRIENSEDGPRARPQILGEAEAVRAHGVFCVRPCTSQPPLQSGWGWWSVQKYDVRFQLLWQFGASVLLLSFSSTALWGPNIAGDKDGRQDSCLTPSDVV